MTPVEFGINVFIALFALIDPIGTVPMFAAATAGTPAPAQRRIAVYVAVFAAVFMIFFFATGTALLRFFGISMPAFRIAGGLMLLLMGLSMARDDFSTMFAEEALEAGEAMTPRAHARQRFEQMIVPFGMPLLIGPGAISAAVIYSGEVKSNDLGLPGYLAGGVAIVAVCALVGVIFMLAGVVARVLGKIGMTIVVRVLGLILTAMAVQFIIVGVSQATQGIIRGSAAHPYPSGAVAPRR